MGDLFKELVFDELVKLAIKKLISKFAFLGWGPIGILTNFAVTKFAEMLYENLEEYIEMRKIAFRNKKLEKEFNKKAVHLKLISRQFEVDSPEFLEAKNEAKKALSNIVMFDSARGD